MNLCSELARVILILVPSCGRRMGSELSAIVLRLYGGRGGLGLTHVSIPAGSGSGGLLLKPGQVLGSDSVVSPGFLSGNNQQAGAIRSPSSSRGAIHFQDQSFPEYDQKFVYLKDTDTEDVGEHSAQSKNVSMRPDWPQNPNLLTTPPVKTAAPTPVPPMRMYVTNQAAIHNPGQGEMSGGDSADKSPVISQGSSGHEGGKPSRQSDREGRMSHGYSDHTLLAHPGSKNMGGTGVSGRDHHAGVP